MIEEKARIIWRELGIATSPPPVIEVESNSTDELLCGYTYLMHKICRQPFVGIVHPAGPLWKRIPRKLKKKWKKLKIWQK